MIRLHRSFRFSPETVSRLLAIARHNQESRNATLSRLVEEEYSRLFAPLVSATHSESVQHISETPKGEEK